MTVRGLPGVYEMSVTPWGGEDQVRRPISPVRLSATHPRPSLAEVQAHRLLGRIRAEGGEVGPHAVEEGFVVSELAGHVAVGLLRVEVQVVEPRIRVLLCDARE